MIGSSTLAIVLILNSLFQWEFCYIETINDPEGGQAYCEQLAREALEVYRGVPGNMKIVCSEDKAVDL
jgi:hypothetical protein